MNIKLYNTFFNNLKENLLIFSDTMKEFNEIINIINNNNIINIDIDINNINNENNEISITTIEYSNLYECIFILFDNIVNTDIIYLSNVNYKEYFTNEVYNLFETTIFDNVNIEELEYIYQIIIEIGNIYLDNIIIPRSNNKTFIKKVLNKKNISNQINYLKNIPQPQQRTSEWYEFRHNILTASNIWKAFDSESSYDHLIYEKCKPLDISKYSNVNTNTPMHWGQKYEPISILWYEYEFNTKITDFGCIKHNKIKSLAASPDGINTLYSSPRYGRMLEIKNIVNRKIDGIPKKEYWIQMQIQMETCDLDECDFLETKFIEYENEEEFYLDGTFQKSNDNNYKGIIIYFIKDEMPFYQYSPFMCNEDEFKTWETTMMNNYNHLTWMKNIYWKLTTISCVLVERNKQWFNKAKPIINKLWETIEFERNNGYHHRAPKKRKCMKNNIITNDNIFNKCVIDINNFPDNE